MNILKLQQHSGTEKKGCQKSTLKLCLRLNLFSMPDLFSDNMVIGHNKSNSSSSNTNFIDVTAEKKYSTETINIFTVFIIILWFTVKLQLFHACFVSQLEVYTT